MKRLLFILLFCGIGLGQGLRPNSVQGWHLGTTAKDTIKTLITDSLWKVNGDPLLTGLDSVGVYEHLSSMKLRTLEEYGAVGDGVTDDSAAIVTAINSGFPLVAQEGKTYLINGSINISNTNIVITATSKKNRPIFRFDNSNGDGFAFGSYSTDTKDTCTLADTAAIGDTRITVDDATGFEAGDLVRLISNVLWDTLGSGSESCFKGELLSIWRVEGDTIYFNESVNDNYDPATETVMVYNFDPISILIDGIKIVSSNKSTTSRGIVLTNAYNSAVTNCVIDSFSYGIILYSSLNFDISQNFINNGRLAYGVSTISCRNVKTYNNTVSKMRRGVDVGGGSTWWPGRFNGISYNFISSYDSSGAYGLGSHTNAEFTTYSNNTIQGSVGPAFVIRGKNEKILNNRIIGLPSDRNQTAQVIRATTGCENLIVRNNIYDSGLSNKLDIGDNVRSRTPKNFVMIDSLVREEDSYWIIEDNTFMWKDVNYPFVSLSPGLSNVIIRNNTVGFWGWSPILNQYFLASTYGDTITVSNSIIKDNYFIVKNGTFNFIKDKEVLFDVTCDVKYELNDSKFTYSISDSSMIPLPTLSALGEPVVPTAGQIYFKQGQQTKYDTLFIYFTDTQKRAFLSDSVGITNYSAVFDSATVLSLATDVGFDSTEAWTFELWVKENYSTIPASSYIFDDTDIARSALQYTSSNSIVYYDSSYSWGLSGNYVLGTSSSTFENGWVHIACKHNGSGTAKIILYDNDSGLEYTEEQTSSPWFHFYMNQIGAYTSGTTYFWKGYVDEFRVWNDVRTDDEIENNRKKELTGSEDGLLYYWNFDKVLTSSATENTLTEDEGTVTYDSLDVPFHE